MLPLEVKWKSQLYNMYVKLLSLECLGMKLARLSLINLVQKSIVRSCWDNAAAQIREWNSCHSSV